MAIKLSREILIEASPDEVFEVIADLEALPEWSPAHQSCEVIETGDDGRPSRAKMTVKVMGFTDEQEMAYTWTDATVSWTLISASQQGSQDASYTLIPEGQGTRVKFQITIDPVVPLPELLLKRAAKGGMDSATDGLRKRVLSLKEGHK